MSAVDEAVRFGSGAELRPADHGAAGDGRTDDGAVLEALVRGVAPEKGGTLVLSAPHRVACDLDLPTWVAVRFEAAGALLPGPGCRVTLRGPVAAGERRVFGGTGEVVFGDGAEARLLPAWWGAAGDGHTDDTAALQAALDALPPAGGRMRVPVGTYRLTAPLRLSGRTGFEVGFEPGAELRPEGPGFALEVRGCARWLVRGARVVLDERQAGAVRVRASSRGLLHRLSVEAAGELAAGSVAVAVEDAGCTEVHAPTVRGRFTEGVRFAGRSDGSRLVGGEVRGARAGVRVDDSDGVTVDGTLFDEVRTAIVLASSPERECHAPFTAISARFERVECGVEIRSVAGAGRVQPPLLSDLRHAPGVTLVRALPGVAYRLIAPVRLEEPPPSVPRMDLRAPSAAAEGSRLIPLRPWSRRPAPAPATSPSLPRRRSPSGS